ncbi:sigma-54-dependent transcriptional regulator [Geofilum sp. OHC36d9]|uniref:sigma-54-dependent transcriptional regulator n=1 Tax=Geofilum sp. OHC36d9 TaxID=3458413 RepID=UPI004033F3E3
MKIFIVEDDPLYSSIIERILTLDASLSVYIFSSGKDLLNQLHQNPDVITLDLGLPDIGGIELFDRIRTINPDVDIVIISGQDDINLAVDLLKKGAYEYIAKDHGLQNRLQNCLKNLKLKHQLQKEVFDLRHQVTSRFHFQDILIGESSAIKEVEQLIEKAIKIFNLNVSLYGETGSGKKFIAKTIHYNSSRQASPFVVFSADTVLPDHQMEELFGVDKNGMEKTPITHHGKLEEADDGTLYIENFDKLTQEVQLLLLKVLQENRFYRKNGYEAHLFKARVITSSQMEPGWFLQSTHFNKSLFYQLAGLPIYLPALRRRKRDVILLAEHFLKSFCKENNLPQKGLTARARKKLLEHSYPGNIRELKTIIDLAAVLSNGDKVDEMHLTFTNSEEPTFLSGVEHTLKEYNEIIFRFYLKKYRSVIKVAELLDIGKSTLYNFLKQEKEKKLEK